MYGWPSSHQYPNHPTAPGAPTNQNAASQQPAAGFVNVNSNYAPFAPNPQAAFIQLPFLMQGANVTAINVAGVPPATLAANPVPLQAPPAPVNDDAVSWQLKLSHLAHYKGQHGSTNVPMEYPILGQWVHDIRQKYELMQKSHGNNPQQMPLLTEGQVQSLNALGFEWTMPADDNAHAWEDRFRALCKFKANFGHCMVPARYPADRQLGHWVMTQRRQYHLLMKSRPSSSMTRDRTEKLNSLGFVWSVRTDHDEMWNLRFEELKTFRAKHGDCLVPQRYPPNPQLGTWVNTQRRHYKLMKDGKHSSMTEDRVQLLEDMGFVWVTSRGAPPLKKRSGKNESAVGEPTAKQKLNAYDIAARRFPDGQSPLSKNVSLSGSIDLRNDLRGSAASASTSSFALGMQAQPPSDKPSPRGKSVTSKPARKKQQSRWICDVCHVATFTSFEDAYAHESKCQKGGTSPKAEC